MSNITALGQTIGPAIHEVSLNGDRLKTIRLSIRTHGFNMRAPPVLFRTCIQVPTKVRLWTLVWNFWLLFALPSIFVVAWDMDMAICLGLSSL